jgi:hypothetical protein
VKWLLSILVLLTIASTLSAQTARRDSVMYWDDGEYEANWRSFRGVPGSRLAVRFTAPAWAQSVTDIDFFMTEPAGSWPHDPVPPPDSTYPFVAHVWLPDEANPEAPGQTAASVDVPGGHPWDSWLAVALPAPVGIVGRGNSRDAEFFVGIEWLYRAGPRVGKDETPPIFDRTWFAYFEPWVLQTDGDAMIRATVSDQPGTPVSGRSWSIIKCLFR